MSAALGFGKCQGRGVLWLLLSREDSPFLITQTFIPGALRAALEATGEGRGLAARGAHPQPVPRTQQVRVGA